MAEHPLAVGRDEIAAKGAINGIAQPFAVGAGVKHFGKRAEIGDGANCHVRQRDTNFLTHAGRRAMVKRGHHRKGGISARQQVPCGEHMIDRLWAGAGKVGVTDR